MLRFLATTALTLIGNALGLLIASWIVPGFELSLSGFIWSVVFFTVAQLILAPFVFKMAVDYLPALRGGIALVTIALVIILTALFTDGLRIDGLFAIIVAPFVVWVVTVLAGVVLPLFLFKKTLGKIKDAKTAKE